jgi:hypothetical protein
MKMFISWSGERSKALALVLEEWFPMMLQNIKPFISDNIEKGTKGLNTIAKELEETNYGVICLTKDNLDAKWIHYEAGALLN